MRDYSIVCDWLQVYCSNTHPSEFDLTSLSTSSYTFVKDPMSSRQFRDIYNVYDARGDNYANIQCSPFSSIIDSTGCIIKLSNRELYKCDFANVFLSFLSSYGFKYKSISRIDVCYDFNEFCQGLKPRRLINQFLAKKYLKNNQGNYQLMGSTSLINDYSYIRFGTRKSAVCSYMYDKTKELREVKDKPYIRQRWAENGIDEKREVWRVEISIKSDIKNMVCTETGDIFKLDADALTTQSSIESVFYIYAKKYFSFKLNNGTKNKSRMPDIPLFERINEVTRIPMRITLKSDSGRSDKLFVKKLHKIKTELRDVDEELSNAIERVRFDFCIQKNLSEYYYKKVAYEDERRQ